jgi:hypothetical protein
MKRTKPLRCGNDKSTGRVVLGALAIAHTPSASSEAVLADAGWKPLQND